MFIFPSESECCSLVQGEAAVAGKYMVLNRDFLPMLEFSAPNVSHFQFNANNPDSNEEYYKNVAREIIQNLSADRAFITMTKARCKYYNKDWIFKQQLEPMFYGGN